MADQHDPLASVEPSRRSFIKKMAAAAFVAPVISSFGMETLAAASSSKPGPPKQSFPNQPRPPKCDDRDDKDDKGKDKDKRGRRDDDKDRRKRP